MPQTLTQRLIHRPQQIWLRKALFQIHLWVGLAIAVYVILIGLTGSILVFRDEIERVGRPASVKGELTQKPKLSLADALDRLHAAFPGKKVTFLYAPKPEIPTYRAYVGGAGRNQLVFVDPQDGRILAQEKIGGGTFIGVVGSLHYFLLMNRSPGLTLNGIGAALLLLLSITGLVIWWPGLKAWKRALSVNFSKSWKRINFDSHSAIGFWTLAIVSFWAISGVYFAWPEQFVKALNVFSRTTAFPGRAIRITSKPTGAPLNVRAMIAKGTELNPGTTLTAMSIPATPKAPLLLYFSRTANLDLLEANYAYFDPNTGKPLLIWRRGEKDTLGNWILWAMIPVHFGTEWGMTVKVIWALLGLSLPVLTITGFFMYWNRYLSKKWKQIKVRKTATVPKQEPQTVGTGA